jgi:hypothetical protein
MGTKEQLRKRLDDLRVVNELQRRSMRDMRSPAAKVHDAGQLLSLYISMGGKLPRENDVEETVSGRQRTLEALRFLKG